MKLQDIRWLEIIMNDQSHLFFRVALLAFLVGIDLPGYAFDEDEANPAPKDYSGVWIVKGGDGKVLSEVSYKEGKRQGLARGWHPNGELRFSAHYRDGHLEGVSAIWDDDGLLTRLTVDEPDGTHRWTEFFSNGHRSEEQVSKDGKLLRRRMWHSTGAKANDYSCRNGKPHGKYTSWHPNGTVSGKGLYENGEPVGEFTTWNAEGKLERIRHHQNGKIVRIAIYEDDKVVAIEYWENGKVVRTEKVK